MNKKKLNLFKFILVLSFVLGINFNAQAKFQVGILAGQSKETSTSSTGLSFLLQSGNMFRFISSFSYFTGGTNKAEGEFAIGGTFYPLASLTKSFVQPFFGLSAFVGLNQESSSPNAGFDYSVGVDLKILKKYGLTIKGDRHSSPSSQRLAVGFYSLH